MYYDDAHRQKAKAEDRSVAVQAVERGFVAIAPATRGLNGFTIPDRKGRHGDVECRSHVMHCLLAGRTAIGERVWDMQRLLDWALDLSDVDSAGPALMMGNSGGGMVTLFTAACDDRIDIAVPSCSFSSSVSRSGYIFHCDCNMVPGLWELGGLPGVAGLIAPRHLLAVNGRDDKWHKQTAINRAVAIAERIYEEAEAQERFEHRWGDDGHRFYADLMWPFVRQAVREENGTTNV